MLINHDEQYCFWHIPKTAGTYISSIIESKPGWQKLGYGNGENFSHINIRDILSYDPSLYKRILNYKHIIIKRTETERIESGILHLARSGVSTAKLSQDDYLRKFYLEQRFQRKSIHLFPLKYWINGLPKDKIIYVDFQAIDSSLIELKIFDPSDCGKKKINRRNQNLIGKLVGSYNYELTKQWLKKIYIYPFLRKLYRAFDMPIKVQLNQRVLKELVEEADNV